MLTTNVTELRRSLPKYLNCIQKGEHVLVTSHGRVIARILPPIDAKQEARTQLKQLQSVCRVGDVISPIPENWDATS